MAHQDKAWLNVERKQSTADWKQTTPEGRRQMKERYKFIMKEVNDAVEFFISSLAEKPFQFLDVCCCPGGFSEYVLVTAPQAKGVGLSLPVHLGGHIPSFETLEPNTGVVLQCPLVDPDRYELHFEDVTTIAGRLVCNRMQHVGGKALNPKSCIQICATPEMADGAPDKSNCDLIILDGSFLGGKSNIYMESSYDNDQQNPAFNCYQNSLAAHQALLAAQLAIMTQNAAVGTSVVLRMSMNWSHFTNGVLAILRRIFMGSIQGYKPRSCHQTAISYYLVCRDYNPAVANKLKIGERFKDLVQALRAGQRARELVPFPELPEGCSVSQLYRMWGLSLQVYHTPLWLFRKLSFDAEKEPVVYGMRFCHRPCWRNLVFRDGPAGCAGGDGPGGIGKPKCLAHGSVTTTTMCKQGAHEQYELHPFSTVAFNQINSHLFLPRVDGTLSPGQGHSRKEQDAVVTKMAEWCKAQLLRNMGIKEQDLNPLQIMQLEMQVTMMVVNVHQQVWNHMLQICAYQEQQLFFGDTENLAPRFGPGGILLRSANLMANQAHFSAARILRGPVPGAPPQGSALKNVTDAYIGYKPSTVGTKASLMAMFGVGRRNAGGGLAGIGPYVGRPGGDVMRGEGGAGGAGGGGPSMGGDGMGGEGVGGEGVPRGENGGAVRGGLTEDEQLDGDEDGEGGAQPLSGYAVTFMDLQLPEDDKGYSLQAIMDYL